MSGSDYSHVPSFNEVINLVQNIQVIDGKLSSPPNNEAVVQDQDSLRVLEKLGHDRDTLSFNDLMRILSNLLRNNYHFDDIVSRERQYQVAAGYPIQYLLFDACLAILDRDSMNARLFLAHAFNIMHFNQSLNLILLVIINTPLVEDRLVREFVALLAFVSKPPSAKANASKFGPEFEKRFQVYDSEIKKLVR